MPQPEYVPIATSDRVRPAERLPVPAAWTASRPADLDGPDHPSGQALGTPGPDQGYALRLARHFRDRLVLTDGISAEDAIAGGLGGGLRRAALFGRAPVIHDLELSFTLWGFLGGAPDDLIADRRALFAGAAHHYRDQRAITGRVPDSTLRLTPAEVRDRLDDWRSLVAADPGVDLAADLAAAEPGAVPS